MKNIKVRKLSIGGKLTIGIALLSTIICLFLGGTIFYRVYAYFQDTMRIQAMDNACVAAKVIDQDLLKSIKPGMEDSEEFQQMSDELRKFLESDTMEYIYVMRLNDAGQPEFWVDADTEEPAGIGELYEDAGEELMLAFTGVKSADQEPTTDEWGSYLSGYAPIIDDDGKTIGIIGVDVSLGSIWNNMKDLLMVTLIIAVVSILLSCLGNGLLVRSITSKLRLIIRKMDDVVHSDGDLTKKIVVRSGDEMEIIANLLNEFIGELCKILGETQRLAQVVLSTTQDTGNLLSESQQKVLAVSNAMQDMGSMMEDTAMSMEKIQEANIKVTDTADQVVQTSQEGSQYMDVAKSRAEEVRRKAQSTQEETVAKAREIAETVSEKIAQAKAVEAIAELSQTIINISKQSNLLAINAAIEAARAGESGRGFAVVADEISTLATTSKNSAEEIGKVCESAISSVNELAEASNEIVAFLNTKVYKDYDSFVENGDRYYNDAVQMRTYMEEFAEKSKELNRAVRVTQDAITTISAAVEEGNANVTVVADTAMELKQEMQSVIEVADVNKEEVGRLNNAMEKFIIE